MDIRNIIVELQPYIMTPPLSTGSAHKQACSNDEVTINQWYDTWISNIKANKEKYGSFADNSVGKLYETMAMRPCIVAGSGPSLKRNLHLLRERPSGMGLVSCLHNFHAMEDAEASPDFYVSLDAGPVTVEEVYEGGSKTPDEYWEMTKDRKLVCYIGTSPLLLEKWQGEVYFFNAPVPHAGFREAVDEIEPFHLWVESGGNVLGASVMITKGFIGSQVIVFVGADFSFSNEEKVQFHPWDSKYDKEIGQCIRVPDIYGNSRKTWASYQNFKLWFDVVAQRIPGIYINATEGGTLGAYPQGNIMHILQKTLKEVYDMFTVHRHKEMQVKKPEEENNTVFI